MSPKSMLVLDPSLMSSFLSSTRWYTAYPSPALQVNFNSCRTMVRRRPLIFIVTLSAWFLTQMTTLKLYVFSCMGENVMWSGSACCGPNTPLSGEIRRASPCRHHVHQQQYEHINHSRNVQSETEALPLERSSSALKLRCVLLTSRTSGSVTVPTSRNGSDTFSSGISNRQNDSTNATLSGVYSNTISLFRPEWITPDAGGFSVFTRIHPHESRRTFGR